jgi:hypothetical protein
VVRQVNAGGVGVQEIARVLDHESRQFARFEHAANRNGYLVEGA